MNTAKTWQTASSKSDDTFAIGEQLGLNCHGGEIFVLSSDLGGGKTTFTKGLAKGMGSTDSVGSPTFTINRVYKAAHGLTLQHFDFYRLNDAGIVAHELAEFVNDPQTVVVIEWGDVVSDVLPENRIAITFTRLASSEDAREITAQYPTELAYIFEGLTA